jgi:hypothetical protein
MNIPYIGVTDFTSRDQVVSMTHCIPPWIDRLLHVGAMMSYKTLNNIPTATGWENIWLNEAGLNALFVKEPNVFNVLHYADYPGDNGESPKTDSSDLIKAIKICGPGVQGIQLDMIWPKQSLLSSVKDSFPGLSIILQVSSRAIEQALKHQLSVPDVLEGYDLNTIDYVLLDYGMGKGVPFAPEAALNLVSQVLTVMDQTKLAVAGGLGPDTYKNIASILAKYPNISCDAQGQLRDSGSAMDPLNMRRVEQYIKGICSLL